MIYKHEIFVDDAGNTIEAHWPVHTQEQLASGDLTPPRFTANVFVTMPVPKTDQVMRGEKRVRIPGDTVHEAFANFPGLFATTTAAIEADLKKQLLLMPGMPVGVPVHALAGAHAGAAGQRRSDTAAFHRQCLRHYARSQDGPGGDSRLQKAIAAGLRR